MPKILPKEISLEEAKEIYSLREKNLSLQECADKLGIARGRVDRCIRKFKKLFSPLVIPRNRRVLEETYKKAFELHHGGMSWPEIGKELGQDPRKFARAFRKRYGQYHNTKVNHDIRSLKGKKRFEHRNKRILELLASGKNMRQISDIMDISYYMVYNVVRRVKNPRVFVPDIHN